MLDNEIQIEGSCHCQNIQFSLSWPGKAEEIQVRECGCTFCEKHSGAWTSNAASELSAMVADPEALSKYRFGTNTADFYVCSRCGVVPFVTSEIDGNLYAVVNVHSFTNIDTSCLTRSTTNFDGEGEGDRLGRRCRNWISTVQVSTPAP